MSKIIEFKEHRLIESLAGYFCGEFTFSLYERNVVMEDHEFIEDFFVRVRISEELINDYDKLNSTVAKEKIAFQRAKFELKKAVGRHFINMHSEAEIRADDLQNYFSDLNDMASPEDFSFQIEVDKFVVKRNYWHMQLHPNDPEFKKEIDVLEQTGFIGLGSWENGEEQLRQFKDEMRIGDVVLIKRGSLALSLVEITGEFEETADVNHELDWFENRRKVKVLDINKSVKSDFPYSRGTLKKASNPVTPTYQYIDAWYQKLMLDSKSSDSNKICLIRIKNFKMFQDFEIDFCDKNNKPSPVIVLAGINGSGKTSLLEYIANFRPQKNATPEDYVFFGHKDFSPRSYENKTNAKKNIVYLPVDFGKMQNLKEQILNYIDELILEKDYRASEAYRELGNTINEIFEGMNLKSRFSRINKDKEIIFKNANEKEFNLQDLSTGEKTLLTKVLFLYLSKFKNMVILIDEPEQSLHPSWQTRLLDIYETFAEKNNSQIVIATHSPIIIAGTKKEYLRLLDLKEGKAMVVNFLPESYGMKFDQVLLEIMGLTQSRTPRVEEKFNELKDLIINNLYESDEFKELWDSLEKDLNEDDADLNLLKLELLYRENAKNRQN